MHPCPNCIPPTLQMRTKGCIATPESLFVGQAWEVGVEYVGKGCDMDLPEFLRLLASLRCESSWLQVLWHVVRWWASHRGRARRLWSPSDGQKNYERRTILEGDEPDVDAFGSRLSGQMSPSILRMPCANVCTGHGLHGGLSARYIRAEH